MSKSVLPIAALAVLAAGCPTVDLGDAPPDPGRCRPDPGYYETTIWPALLAPDDPERSCASAAGCHRSDDGRSSLRLDMPPPDQPELVAHATNYAVVTRFLNCGAPEASPLLTKPLQGMDPHGGGELFNANDPVVALFLQWFEQ